EHELSQEEAAVEITPLSAKDELPEAQNFLTGTVHQNTAQVGRTHRSGFRRYLLIVLTLCMLIALFLVTVVLPRYQTQKPSSHPSSLTASPTLNTTATPASVPIDYSVNTTIVNGVAYASAANGAVYALRTSDGKLLWRHKINTGVATAPLVSGGIIFINVNISSDVGPGILYALRVSDGVELWHYTDSNPLSKPVVANGIVYVTTYDVVSQNGNLTAIRGSDGAQLWHNTGRGLSYNTPIVDSQIVYVSAIADNGSSVIYALHANNGAQLWRVTTTTFTTLPFVVNRIVYLVSNQGLSALQASNGQLIWKVPIVGNTTLSPIVSNGVLYLTTASISLASSAFPTSQESVLPPGGTIG
ncbi:MAG TPA: PQQ-binding-like beta-propeller repeat protein, partial [Ktedonobacteraceae bacterium]|nr:PQQ-binding-like beta-propeller repeat protein [Ktedonobacteraceae bacterium]